VVTVVAVGGIGACVVTVQADRAMVAERRLMARQLSPTRSASKFMRACRPTRFCLGRLAEADEASSLKLPIIDRLNGCSRWLFRRYDLVDKDTFGLRIVALFIGVV
jgi:hypothetical protein